jgi:hypothetical protein
MTTIHSGRLSITSAAAVALSVALSVVTLEAVKTRIERDPKFDFKTLKTWVWNSTGPGQVKVWVTADSKSEPVQRQYEPVIMEAVESEFKARGYPMGTSLAPDFHVTYYVLVTVGNSSQQMGQFLPTNAQWGIPLWSPNTSAMTFYPQGTMLIDVASMATGNLVWRGIAEAKVEVQNSEAERSKRLREVIKDLVSKFPKKAS